MNMKKYVLILMASFFVSNGYARLTESMSIGFSGGYSCSSTFRGELFLKSDLQLFNRNSEVRFGISNHSYQLTFDNVSGLNTSSIGLFGDIAIFPFNKGLFVGARWEAINFNWFSEESRNRMRRELGYELIFFTGTSTFLQVGYHLQISNNFGIRLYGQPGIQHFRINLPVGGRLITEEQLRFIYNVNLGFTIRIR